MELLRKYIKELIAETAYSPQSQIFCDMDGVLVNFEARLVEYLNSLLDGCSLIGVEPSAGHMKRMRKVQNTLGHDWRAQNRADLDIKIVRNFMMGSLGANPGPVFASMQPWPDAIADLWPYLTSRGLTVNILSAPIQARPGAAMTAEEGKTFWVKNHLRPQPTDIILTPAKSKVDYATTDGIPNILIDDKASTVESWNGSGGLGILHMPGNSTRTIAILKEIGL